MASALAVAAEQRLARAGCLAVQIEQRTQKHIEVHSKELGLSLDLAPAIICLSLPLPFIAIPGISFLSVTSFVSGCAAGTCLAGQSYQV